MSDRSNRKRIALALKRRGQQLDSENPEEDGCQKPYRSFGWAFPQPAADAMVTRPKRTREPRYQKDNDKHRANETSLAKSTRTIARFTIALVFVSIVSAFVSFLQWREMNSSGTQADKLIETNRQLADAAKKSADISDKNLIATQRAWVGVTDAAITPANPNTIIKANISYVNSGKEPARFQGLGMEYVYDKESWDGGKAVEALTKLQDECLSIQNISGNRFAWPTTGFTTYILHIPDGRVPQNGVATWTDRVINGKDIVAVQGSAPSAAPII
jgi:hypothetical protein